MSDLNGKTVIVTAGSTIEMIDDVRFLSNRSSGKMGFALARAALEAGAKVVLVSRECPENLKDRLHHVECSSAADVYEAVRIRFEDCYALIAAAAVADYTPERRVFGKIKKAGSITLNLVPTFDTLFEMGKIKTTQKLVGFAAEVKDHEKSARKKLEKKNLDAICLNDISNDEIGFDSDYNEVDIFFRDGRREKIGRAKKEEIARRIIELTI